MSIAEMAHNTLFTLLVAIESRKPENPLQGLFIFCL